MLQPKRTKYRKQFRGKMRGAATSGNVVTFGEVGMKAMEPSWITARQIEAARIAVTRHLKRGGQVWVRLFPDKSVSKKAAETRMGGGQSGSGLLGGRGEAGACYVRGRRSPAGGSRGGPAAGVPEAAHPDQDSIPRPADGGRRQRHGGIGVSRCGSTKLEN